METLETVFAAVVAVLAALAVIGALVFMVIWEWCAIRRTLAVHRRQPPDASRWREGSSASSTTPAEHDLIREGAGRILAGHPLRGIALDWKGRGSHGQRRP
jgi:hypothetical protein